MESSALVSAGSAADILKVGRQQVYKLIDCGLLGVPQLTAGGQRRLELVAVLELADRGQVILPPPGAPPDLAVHLGPLRSDPDGLKNQRAHLGWQQGGGGLTAAQIEDAWAGVWNCDPDPYIGSALVGDVAGFVVVTGAVTGARRINGLVRFEVAPATPDMERRYAARRFTAIQGGMVQPLWPAAEETVVGEMTLAERRVFLALDALSTCSLEYQTMARLGTPSGAEYQARSDEFAALASEISAGSVVLRSQSTPAAPPEVVAARAKRDAWVAAESSRLAYPEPGAGREPT